MHITRPAQAHNSIHDHSFIIPSTQTTVAVSPIQLSPNRWPVSQSFLSLAERVLAIWQRITESLTSRIAFQLLKVFFLFSVCSLKLLSELFPKPQPQTLWKLLSKLLPKLQPQTLWNLHPNNIKPNFQTFITLFALGRGQSPDFSRIAWDQLCAALAWMGVMWRPQLCSLSPPGWL